MSINKKLIALDLDGTLLESDQTISFKTKKYLKELEDRGNLIVLCSGSAKRSVIYYYNDIGLRTSPIICYNGHFAASIYDNKFPPIKHKINFEELKSLYKEIIGKLVDSVMSENNRKIYVDKDDDFLFEFYHKNDLKIIKGPLDKTLDEDVYTFVMKFDNDPEKKENLINLFKTKYTDLRVRFWFGGDYCEVYKKGISKAKTILEVAKLYGIDKKDIIVFGDADNDIEMLEDYNSYLMKNGAPHLASIAKHVTEYTNDEDGVIYELKKVFKDN